MSLFDLWHDSAFFVFAMIEPTDVIHSQRLSLRRSNKKTL